MIRTPCLALAVLALLMSPAAAAAPARSVTPPQPPAVAPSPLAIPMAEVAARAAAVSDALRTTAAQAAPSPEIQAILARLPEVSRQIDAELELTTDLLRRQPALATIATQQKAWQDRQLQATGWLSLLTARATRFQEALNRLAELRATWRDTAVAARAAAAPAAVAQQIAVVIASIADVERLVQAERARLLDLQGRVGHEVARCGTALAQIGQAQQRAMGGILAQGARPIWDRSEWADLAATFPARIREAAEGRWRDLARYAGDRSGGLPWQIAGFLVLAALFRAARRRARQWAAAGEDVSRAAVFERPYAAALLLPLFYVASPYSPLPSTLKQLFELIVLLPVIRVIRPVTDTRVISALYVLPLLFALDIVRQDYGDLPVFEQAILALETLAAIGALGYALTWGRLGRSPDSTAETDGGVARPAALLVLLTLGVGLGSALCGYTHLARLLVSGVLASGVLALTLQAWVRAFAGLTALALHVRPLRLLRMVRHHRDLLARRALIVLGWLAVGAWTFRTLDYMGLFQPAQALAHATLAARLQAGSIGVSVRDVLEFFLLIWLAYLLSAFIRFALQEEVYPRVGLARGRSYAISSLLNYVIIAFGFVLGLGVLGLDLTKVTVLAGAFGVGIGFGLQGVVNNFVSGLVLLFERPIHVGDTVEVADLSGEVSRIGIRASTLRTMGGAEIIVPNAQLVSERVINWTLSDRLRRIELPVGVNYGASPKDVIAVLEAVARAHPHVLPHPEPQAYFTGFGDSAINFELRAWTDQFEQWFQIRSELATAVYDAVTQAGISFPYPQREVRLLQDGGPAIAGLRLSKGCAAGARSQEADRADAGGAAG